MEQDLFEESFASSFGSEEEFDANTTGALTAALADNRLALLIRYENSARRAYHKALAELRSLQSERRKAQQSEQKAAHDAHVRQVVGEMEAANEKDEYGPDRYVRAHPGSPQRRLQVHRAPHRQFVRQPFRRSGKGRLKRTIVRAPRGRAVSGMYRKRRRRRSGCAPRC
jgi:hypothetical protein